MPDQMTDIPHTRVDRYLSRVLHMLTAGLLMGATFAPYIYKEPTSVVSKWIPIGAVVISALTGLYNADAAKPGRFGANAFRYRALVYGGKSLILLLCTPLTAKLVPTEVAQGIQLGASLSLVAIGSYLKYYREENIIRLASAGTKTS
eukprot:CAMPEP_0201476044 /NCGR_PEP_ID=MMETSP0151_2-20130828/1345_1 /ASSEMBLY_ACC=CAM_ASM_000257 /TAXON_ID=200890 /ORGANISM="Paramoeba atlantica, Strain 621/1 / CCAP 1560/9" /LENGTH=146 /DNA_ID=CAMNT_0047856313 /DNA_START=40 /DNA_END=480 /DNA_ORIENTATION=-